MELFSSMAEWFVPDGLELSGAISRTTHLAVGAHQDDLEIMAGDGILQCFGQKEKWFTGVVITDGAGSPRNGIYASYTDDQMKAVRRAEQKKAACIGEYAALAQLNYPSAKVKDTQNLDATEDIFQILRATRPEIVYTHNLADKHPTHVVSALRVIDAVRKLAENERPQKLYGCEIWRGLDWMPDGKKVSLDVSGHPSISTALISVFDSQICGGKRYDLATHGRRAANATYARSHDVDTVSSAIYAMDLTPLMTDASMDITSYVSAVVQEFLDEVQSTLKSFGR